MKFAAAARQLEMALITVFVLSRTGQLDVDPETDSSGARFVTRASVDAYSLCRRQCGRPAALPGVVALAEVARFTEECEQAVLNLVHAGVLDQMPGRRHCLITSASVAGWMGARVATGFKPALSRMP